MNESLNEWVSEWMVKWMNRWMSEWMNGLMNEWLNEWVSKWMNGWMIEWMNTWCSRPQFSTGKATLSRGHDTTYNYIFIIHAPNAGSITLPVDHQSNTLLLFSKQRYPELTRVPRQTCNIKAPVFDMTQHNVGSIYWLCDRVSKKCSFPHTSVSIENAQEKY